MASPEPALVSDMTAEEFERRTLDAIQREFGLGGIARFLMTYRSGKGDYTAERHQWQDTLKREDIIAEIQKAANLPG
jgi:hypothetical protein